MDLKKLLFLISIIIYSNIIFGQWTRINYPLSQLSPTVFDVIDYDTIFAQTNSTLFVSHNNGVNWNTLPHSFSTDQFKWNTSKKVLLDNYILVSPLRYSSILYSKNGGITFDTLKFNEIDTRPYVYYKFRIGFSQENYPYVLTRSAFADTLFHYTNSRTDTVLLPSNIGFNDKFAEVLYMKGDSILLWADSAYTENHSIYKTMDLGLTWQRTRISASSRIVDIKSSGLDTLMWIFDNTIAKSIDGGQTHQLIQINAPNRDCGGISLRGSLVGVSFVEYQQIQYAHWVLKSDDFLNTWSIDTIPNTIFEEIYAIDLLDMNYGWTSGLEALYRLDNLIRTDVSNENKTANKTDVFPNPFEIFFNIKLNTKKEFNSVSIFNISGEEVFNQKINSQTQLSLDPNIPSGVYFVKLVGENSESFKIIKY